jgi:hypothetical protein
MQIQEGQTAADSLSDDYIEEKLKPSIFDGFAKRHPC